MQKILQLLIRYLSAGFIATCVHFMVFVNLLPDYGPALSTFCAAITGALVAYGLSRYWVFAQRACNDRRFFITAASQVLTNTLIVALLARLGAPAQLAQLVALATVTTQGFMFNHLWVFKHDIKRTPQP
ncbi:GtrA family protein [Pseudomonas sp. SDO524_S393]